MGIAARQSWTAIGAVLVALSLVAGVGSPTARADVRIVSTQQGEMPTTGGLRPGPIGFEPPVVRKKGVTPLAIRIEKIQVDAEVETTEIVDGVMQNPTGPWVVSWYQETAKLDEDGNAVMAGHVDYWDVGPAVFYDLNQLVEGDRIEVTGEDGEVYAYEVAWTKLFDAVNAPIGEIVGPTEEESLTLITCGGPFDYETGEYLERLIVRAVRTG